MGALLEERTAELVQTQANGKQLPRSPALSLALSFTVSILTCTRCLASAGAACFGCLLIAHRLLVLIAVVWFSTGIC